MHCCGLSSTGLENIDADEITSDNSTIFSNLNVSGNTNLNNTFVYGNTSLLSSLNVSGFTTLKNNTTIYGTLNVSGFSNLSNDTTIFGKLNVSNFTILSNNTTINGSLYISGLNVLETLNIHGTGLSTLYNFRSDNPEALITQDTTTFSTLIHTFYPGSEIKFDTILSKNRFPIEGNTCLSKIDQDGKLNVYHKYDILLPSKPDNHWVVHDELSNIHKQAILNAAKFVSHDGLIER